VPIHASHAQSNGDSIGRAVDSPIALRRVARIALKSGQIDADVAQSMAWSRDGSLLAASFDWGRTIGVFDGASLRQVSQFGGRPPSVRRARDFLTERSGMAR
jgi:hypothetical protein